jgi:hypothetical protein
MTSDFLLESNASVRSIDYSFLGSHLVENGLSRDMADHSMQDAFETTCISCRRFVLTGRNYGTGLLWGWKSS